jgi:sulfur dioxygenase
MSSRLHFERFVDPETSTYTFLVADKVTKEAALIDSVRELTQTYVQRIRELGFDLTYLLETHVHADHITANARLLEAFPAARIALSAKSTVHCPHVALNDGDVVRVGEVTIETLATPGHTSESVTFLVDGNRLLTGDTLLIGSCGRTDFQAGDSRAMFRSLKRLASYPNETLVYPGHDYNGRFVSTVGEQKANNPLFKLDEEAFVAELASWKLPPPKKLDVSLPGNQNCGA